MASRETIGRKIAALRKLKGFSQEELAARVSISRSSLTQIELGKRGIDILEVKRLALELGFSIDEFLSEDYKIHEPAVTLAHEPQYSLKERISPPSLNVGKLKNILLYIMERCAGKPNVGETVLYKLLYFSDFNYYEQYEEPLSGAAYRKLPYGPVPQHIETIIHQMVTDGNLKRIRADYFGYPQTRYLPLIKADLTIMKASEKDTIDRVIDQMSNWSAATITHYSHKDMPWLATKEGENIEYELVFYREAPYSVREYQEE